MNILRHLKHRLSRDLRSEHGSSMIELAIAFPILLILFVGSVELGRLFYTYTTLAKATEVGARYLSTQRDAASTDATTLAGVTSRTQNLVVCGYTDCTGRTPIVSGLAAATNVKVTLPVAGATVQYVKVEIQSFNFKSGVFNLAAKTGTANTTYYFGLAPVTQMRYMQGL